MSYKRDESYNVSNYTDEQLMTILDLHEPGDRELEERVLFLVNKYTQIGNDGAKRLAQFFIDIYYRFFEPSDDEDDAESAKSQESDTDSATDSDQDRQQTVVEGLDNMDKKGKTQNVVTYNQAGDSVEVNVKKADKEKGETKDEVQIQKTVTYAKDKLNPLLNQTIRRIVSIDSQYRENKSTASTHFTFNL